MAKQEDFLPKEDGKLCVECGFGEWRHGLGSSHQFNANLKNQIDKLDEILDCIVSQEAMTEGGYAEYTTNPKAIAYGNPLNNKGELKTEILKHYISREEVLGKLPEKYTPAEMMLDIDASADYREGYNQAISDMRQALTTNVKE